MVIKKCYMCGKEFISAPLTIYKEKVEGKVKHFCSYACLRKLDKERERQRKSLRR